MNIGNFKYRNQFEIEFVSLQIPKPTHLFGNASVIIDQHVSILESKKISDLVV